MKKEFWLHIFSVIPIGLPLPFLIMLDIVFEVYHQICFPIYGIPKLRRRDYIIIRDRGRLNYLNRFEKIGCMYCGYANGLLAYLKKIANLTEAYWCGIIHSRKVLGHEYQEEEHFVPYDDSEKFIEKYVK